MKLGIENQKFVSMPNGKFVYLESFRSSSESQVKALPPLSDLCFWQASDSVCTTVLTVTLSNKKKNRASRDFFVGLSTTNLKMIWKQTTNKQMQLI